MQQRKNKSFQQFSHSAAAAAAAPSQEFIQLCLPRPAANEMKSDVQVFFSSIFSSLSRSSSQINQYLHATMLTIGANSIQWIIIIKKINIECCRNIHTFIHINDENDCYKKGKSKKKLVIMVLKTIFSFAIYLPRVMLGIQFAHI
jgi:hypothetical protein